MNKQKRTIIIASVVLVALFAIGFLISAKFTAERYEQSITARDQSMQNVWSMTKQAMDMGGFTTKDFSKTFLEGIKLQAERYKDDTGAMMKWVKEASADLNPEVYLSFMKSLDKIFTKKEMSQNNKISVTQEYKTWLNASIKGALATYAFDYPKSKTIKIMDRVIITKETKSTWDTGFETVENPFKD